MTCLTLIKQCLVGSVLLLNTNSFNLHMLEFKKDTGTNKVKFGFHIYIEWRFLICLTYRCKLVSCLQRLTLPSTFPVPHHLSQFKQRSHVKNILHIM